jgi:ParB family chromosome partitioning protein
VTSSARKTEAQVLPFLDTNRANPARLGYVGRSPLKEARDGDSWFTPPEYLDSVRAVMGSIDLDPFTSAKANEIVQASHVFTLERSAFEHDWKVCRAARAFMNPPYSAGLCGRAIDRFLSQYEAKSFVEGIVLVNNATDTRWFGALVKRCAAICFTDHRISFWNADRKNVSGNTRGQSFFYFGRRLDRFKAEFEKHGFVLTPAR